MASPDTYLTEMVSTLQSHAWSSQAPAMVVKGAIPPVLAFPVIGVLASGGTSENQTAVSYRHIDDVDWTVILPVALDDSDKTYEDILAMGDDIMSIVRDNNDWGLVSVEQTIVKSWETSVMQTEDGMNFLQSLTLNLKLVYTDSE